MTPHVVIIGAGPAGLTAAYELVTKYGITSTILESDDHGRRHQPDRRARRLALRHRRPPLLHQGEGGRGVLARDPPRRGLHAAAAHEPDLLRGQVLRLPAQDPERACGISGLWEAFRCVLSYLWVRIRPPKDQNTLEGWIAARFGWRLYRALLQDLQREAVGSPDEQAARGLRRAAHQEPLVHERGHDGAAAEAEPEGDHLPHRGVPVPEVRARDDVGALPRPGRGEGLHGRHEPPRRRRCTTRTTARSR